MRPNRMQANTRRLSPAMTGSISAHALLFLALVAGVRAPAPMRAVTDGFTTPLVWINADTGSGGGGGGGGARQKEVPRTAHAPGRDTVTIDPVRNPPPAPEAVPSPIDRPMPIVAPVMPAALGVEPLAGSIATLPSPTSSSHGAGDGGGWGSGRGQGDGPGSGRGLGDGRDGGFGGGPYEAGGDVTMPIEIRKGSPRYTSDAMRAHAQGAILVRCIVQTTGVCTNARVVRAFEPNFGLDREAIEAASQWRFRPGARRGQPVPVLVTLEIDFAIR
jgi:periplasmic protein TonB